MGRSRCQSRQKRRRKIPVPPDSPGVPRDTPTVTAGAAAPASAARGCETLVLVEHASVPRLWCLRRGVRGAGSATSPCVKLEIIHFCEVQDRDLKWWLAKYKYKSGKLNVFFKNGKFLFFRRLVFSSKGVS